MELNYSWQRIAESYCGNGGGTNVYIRLYGKLNSQSTTNNKSSYSLQCRVYFDKHLITSSITSNIDGTSSSYPGRLEVTNEEVTLQEVSREHTHNNDGTSGNITKGCSWASYYSSVDGSTSGVFTLPRINRQATITSANNFNDEENPSMKFNNPAGFTMNVWLEPNPNGEHLCIRNSIPNTGSYTWELTEEERNQLRAKCTGNSCTVRYGIYTIISGTSYGTAVDKTMTIVNGNPVFENFAYEDTNANITAITEDNQVLVKGLSTLQATIPVANKMETLKQATPKNYVATIDTINQSINYDDENDIVFNLGAISTAGTQRLNIRAYDSRNNSTLVYKDITVYDYVKPVVNFTAERLNNFEEQTTLKINGSFSSLKINDIEKNTIQTVQYRYQEIGEETWSNWQNAVFTIVDNNYECNDIILAFDNTKEFIIEVKVIDKLSDNIVSTTIDVGKSIFFISSNKKTCYINDYEVATFNRVYPIGSIYMNINNTDPNELFGIGTWEQVEGKFLLGASESHAAGTTGGKEKVTLSAAIGSYNNSINTLGFVGASPSTYQLNHNPNYIVAGGNDNPVNKGNHSTVVTEHNVNDRDVTIMPPYLAVYIWKRIA